ncbi:NAD(P)H-binding protein [Microterricola pindariensis]|uniref:NAD(P)-dependent oxidoreductase n=1 Tax=Microterricola pindariensis TaxID=478010 RepID=A0ABX5AWJ8_9MICO|nr:NAD(P)H-binding protein [Microterricola pindariensis]PPL18818.1 NAD(P)-dependent oxidoreductase [Microterricola pindariensis]
MTRIGITGSTGYIGGLVTKALVAGPVPDQTLRLITRDPARLPSLDGVANGDVLSAIEVVQASYDSVTAVDLGELDVVFMVSATESADRREQHRQFVRAATNAGVPHIVYTSFVGADPGATFTLAQDHAYTEEVIRASGMRFTFLRDNLYLDLLPHFADENGVIRGPAGQGRVAAVARADVADAAVAVIRDLPSHLDATYTLTGPEALTLDEIAAATGLTFQNETIEEAYASRAHYGVEQWQLDAWVSTYTAIADGSLAAVSNDVRRLTGHPARSLADLLPPAPG